MASEALKANTTLTAINLGANSIGDEGAKALAEVHSKRSCQCSLTGRVAVNVVCKAACVYDGYFPPGVASVDIMTTLAWFLWGC